MTSDTYNRYGNYETWNVVLWLENEEGTSRYWREAAREEMREAPRCRQVLEGVWPADRAATYRLADRLNEEVEEGAPELEPSLYSDLLSAALSEVDWHEVAEAFLEE